MKRLLSLLAAVPFILAPAIAGAEDAVAGSYPDKRDTFTIHQSLEEDVDIEYENEIEVELETELEKKIEIDLKVVGGEDVTTSHTQSTESEASASGSSESAKSLDIEAEAAISVKVDKGNDDHGDDKGGKNDDGFEFELEAEGSLSVDAKKSKSFEETASSSSTTTDSWTEPAIRVDGISSAVVDNKQILKHNKVVNVKSTNKASLTDKALKDAKGNIGVNVVAGDNNAQDNLTAMAVTEKKNSLIDAEVYKLQLSVKNSTYNVGATNKATLDGSALAGAEGNIGANVAAGDNNAQSNMTAISVGPSKVGIASIAIKQEAAENVTINLPKSKNKDDHDLSLAAAGDLALNDTVSGYPGSWTFKTMNTTNTATLGGEALKGATGNIGVNVAAGTGNLQANALAVTSTAKSGGHVDP